MLTGELTGPPSFRSLYMHKGDNPRNLTLIVAFSGVFVARI